MILRYKLPPRAEKLIPLSDGERIYYAVPVDIDQDGNWSEDSYLIVTTFKVHVLRGDALTTYDIKDIGDASAQPGVGGGLLIIDHNGISRIICHYSSKHLSRYAYVARGIKILVSGRSRALSTRRCARTAEGSFPERRHVRSAPEKAAFSVCSESWSPRIRKSSSVPLS